MHLGEILVAHGLVTKEDVDRGLERQRLHGGRLGENLVAIGCITAEQLNVVLNAAPTAPNSVAATGIPVNDLLNLLIKTINGRNLEMPSQFASEMKLPMPVMEELVQVAVDRKLLESLGVVDQTMLAERRYCLAEKGRRLATEALFQSQYIGPTPVSLRAFQERILRQTIMNEHIERDSIDNSFNDLVIPDSFIRRLGPAINSGRCILLYGPAGNGKTTVAERISAIFDNVVYIPYAFEVDGQIVKVFDASVHQAVARHEPASGVKSIRRENFDARWVACKRPMVITGGELTLEMLDMRYNSDAKFYEAPLHVKALSGTFIIDDFGRQLVNPEQLLNRWIVPLQSRVDFLKLHTGKSFSLPFDELVIFSTNMAPADLMDPAFLRRIPYKLETCGPTVEDFCRIFNNIALRSNLQPDDAIMRFVVNELKTTYRTDLAAYQPKFIVDQVVDACKYRSIPLGLTEELVRDALDNLYPKPSGIRYGIGKATANIGEAKPASLAAE